MLLHDPRCNSRQSYHLSSNICILRERKDVVIPVRVIKVFEDQFSREQTVARAVGAFQNNRPPGRILTAAEEKALLRAQYAAQDARAKQQQQQQQPTYETPYENGVGSSRPSLSGVVTNSAPTTPPPPPPLMPRPPVEYIQETQEEDARVSRHAMNGTIPADDHLSPPIMANGATPSLDVRPFSPFSAGFDSVPPSPPFPPKPAGE
ncbi:hypothetical protein H0H87_009997 [Tephrocybe sp. NHM501043]|nr:hypothetical protein H0H87_009997 [Tephrocybe sp. NHM501043]